MSKGEVFFDAITGVRDDLLEDAQSYRFTRHRPLARYGALAACLAVVVSIGFMVAWIDRLGMGGMAPNDGCDNGAMGETSGESNGMAGSDGTVGSGGMELPWSGVPVLDLAEEDSGVTAVRALTLEFSQDGAAAATDRYTLTNSGETAVTVTLCYEGTGVRSLTLDGQEISSGTALTLEGGGTAEVVLYSTVRPTDGPLTLALPGNLEVTEAALILHGLPDVEVIQDIQGFDQVEVS